MQFLDQIKIIHQDVVISIRVALLGLSLERWVQGCLKYHFVRGCMAFLWGELLRAKLIKSKWRLFGSFPCRDIIHHSLWGGIRMDLLQQIKLNKILRRVQHSHFADVKLGGLRSRKVSMFT